MPQSLTALYVHLVFSTKNRDPLVPQERIDSLHRYLGGCLNSLGCSALGVGGTADHVHALFLLAKTRALSDVVRELKSNSSAWMKGYRREFAWQNGFGAFSFGAGDLEGLRAYLSRQEEHHRKVSFQEELRALLRESGQEWDEHYLWD